MNLKWISLCALGCLALSCQAPEEQKELESLIQYVEPRIGTAHCRWFHFTPGARPFGLAKPAPSTNGSLGNKSGWEATGYDYRDKSIEGFPCLHEFQVGGISLMPTTGELITFPGLPTDSVKQGRQHLAWLSNATIFLPARRIMCFSTSETVKGRAER